jgi:hypothetical protein
MKYLKPNVHFAGGSAHQDQRLASANGISFRLGGNFEELVGHRVLVGRNRIHGQVKGKNTMRFYVEPDFLSGKTDVLSVQAIGDEWVDKRFVVEAETEDEAREKLLDLLEKRVWQGVVRLATEDEAKEFEEGQEEAKKWHEFAARWHEENRVKGVGE